MTIAKMHQNWALQTERFYMSINKYSQATNDWGTIKHFYNNILKLK